MQVAICERFLVLGNAVVCAEGWKSVMEALEACSKTMKHPQFQDVMKECAGKYDKFKKDAALKELDESISEVLEAGKRPDNFDEALAERFIAAWSCENEISDDLGALLRNGIPVLLHKLASMLLSQDSSERKLFHQLLNVAKEVAQAGGTHV